MADLLLLLAVPGEWSASCCSSCWRCCRREES